MSYESDKNLKRLTTEGASAEQIDAAQAAVIAEFNGTSTKQYLIDNFNPGVFEGAILPAYKKLHPGAPILVGYLIDTVKTLAEAKDPSLMRFEKEDYVEPPAPPTPGPTAEEQLEEQVRWDMQNLPTIEVSDKRRTNLEYARAFGRVQQAEWRNANPPQAKPTISQELRQFVDNYNSTNSDVLRRPIDGGFRIGGTKYSQEALDAKINEAIQAGLMRDPGQLF
jgi:hypothetical protein